MACMLVGISAVAAFVFFNMRQSSKWSEHTQHVLYRVSDLLSAVQDTNLFSRGYNLNHDKQFLNRYEQSIAHQIAISQEIEQLTADDPKQQENLKQIRLVGKQFRLISHSLIDTGDIKFVKLQEEAMDNVRKELEAVVAEENQLHSKRQVNVQRFYVTGCVAFILQIIACALMMRSSWLSIKQYAQESDEKVKRLETANQQTIAAKEAAERALETKSKFLSTISHEVRTPIAGVIGIVEMMYVSAHDENIRNLSKIALESCKRLLRILNDLLDASSLQAGAVKLEHLYFAVRPILGDIAQLVGAEAGQKSLEIISTVAADVPETVCGDELRVRQILQNLAFNAVKFTERGHVQIRVDLLERGSDKTTLKFSVIDTGLGISDEQQMKIFQPFVQTKDSTTQVFGGTGLGLSIARTLVELMGGEMGVTSKLNEGSLFWVTIPFRDNLCQRE